MGDVTGISWADSTFNPWIGCTEVSVGAKGACSSCYARELAARYGFAQWGDHPRHKTAPANWRKPLAWERAAIKAGTRPFVFCASLADVFDNQVDPEWRRELFDLIRATPHLVWLLLTKRPQNIRRLFLESRRHPPAGEDWPDPEQAYWPRNAAMGCTVVTQTEADRDIPHLLGAQAALEPAFTFLSMEPLMEAVDISPYLGKNPLYGREQAERGVRLSSGGLRRLGDHARWDDLEGEKAPVGPLATEGGEPPVQAGKGGATGREGRVLFPSRPHAGREAGIRAGAPTGVSPLQGANSSRIDDQPRGRPEEAERAGQPRTGDALGATTSRGPRPKDFATGASERRGEQKRDADRLPGSRDQASESGRREAPTDRRRLQNRDADGLQDRPEGASCGISWCIVGGETDQGKFKARPSNPDWFRSLRDQCAAAGTPFHLKQLGEWSADLGKAYATTPRHHFGIGQPVVAKIGKKAAGRLLDGVVHDARPEVGA